MVLKTRFLAAGIAVLGLAGCSREPLEISGKGVVPCSNRETFRMKMTRFIRRPSDFGPMWVILMPGTNDTKPHNRGTQDEFVRSYIRLVESFQNLESKPRIYLGRPCPVIGEGNFGITQSGVEGNSALDRPGRPKDESWADRHASPFIRASRKDSGSCPSRCARESPDGRGSLPSPNRTTGSIDGMISFRRGVR